MIETTAVSRPRPPDMIPGYRLEKLVGKGGMGEVHKATQLSLGRTVAVKLLSSDLAKDAIFVARFEKEAAALAQLSHPHIVSIVDKGKSEENGKKSDGTYFLVMEFIDGPSLREIMRQPHLDTPAALRIALEICRGIEYAHGRGVIHRDLKPENILFDEQAGRIPKVTDFGLASFLDANSPTKFNVTETHVAMGTLSYMAPEQRVDAKTADHRADIYSLGVILYELLVGELPVGNFDPPSQRRPGLDKRLDAIVARCLKPVPADRYESVTALIADLEPLTPISYSQPPRKVSRVERAGLAVRRFALRVVRITAALLVLFAALIVSVAAYRATREHRFVSNTDGLVQALEPSGTLALPGRISTDPEGRLASMEDGPDTLPIVGTGRRPELDKGAVTFDEPDEGGSVGKATLDLSEMDGYQVQVVAELAAEVPRKGTWATLRKLVTGAEPQPRAALVLEGLPGRYVAVVVNGVGDPIALEWALMERRGTMLGMESPESGKERIELVIDGTGQLRAYAGTGKDRRAIGEPINLGAPWKRHFGKMPRPVLACLEGSCRFAKLAFDVRHEKPAPAAPPPVEKPAPAVKPASTTKKAAPTTTTTAKKTTSKVTATQPTHKKRP